MITKTDFWKAISLGFKDMKQSQEMTERVMAIIKGEKNFESKKAGRGSGTSSQNHST